MNKLKKWLQHKLGIAELRGRVNYQQSAIDHLISVLGKESVVGVDVHFKSPSLVIVFTRAAGGQIRIFDADIGSLRALKEFADYIEYRYGISKHDMWFDSPYGPLFRPDRGDY